jgi:hypothetical protein
LLDDHAPWLFNQETVALTHFATGATHIVKALRIILSGRWHEGALRLRRLRSRRRRWRLNCGWRDRGLSDRLLRRKRTRRRNCRAPLTLLLRNRRRLRT